MMVKIKLEDVAGGISKMGVGFDKSKKTVVLSVLDLAVKSTVFHIYFKLSQISRGFFHGTSALSPFSAPISMSDIARGVQIICRLFAHKLW